MTEPQPEEEVDGSGLRSDEFWLVYGRYPYLLAKLLTAVIVVGAVLYAIRSVDDALFPVIVAAMLAYVLDPSVDWFEARGYSRTTGILLFLCCGGVVTAAFVLVLWPTVAHLVDRIGEVVPKTLDLVEHDLLPKVRELAGDRFPDSVDAAIEQYGGTLRDALPNVANTVTHVIGDLWTRTGGIVASVLNLVLIPVLTFYFLRDFDHMRLAAVEYLPKHNRDALLERIARMDTVVGAWFRGQVEVAAVLAILYAIGLGITMGLAGVGATTGMSVGLLAGLLNIIPYFGFLVGFLLSMVLVILDWSGWMPVVGVITTFAIVQGLEGYVVTPRIVGNKVGLSPAVVIVALLVGGELLGLVGVLLALPIAGIVNVLLPDVIAWYRESDLYTGVVRRRDRPGPHPPLPPVSPPEPPLAPASLLAPLPAAADLVRGPQARDGDPLEPGRRGRVGEAGRPLQGPGQPHDGGGRVPDGDVDRPVPGPGEGHGHAPAEGGPRAPEPGDEEPGR